MAVTTARRDVDIKLGLKKNMRELPTLGELLDRLKQAEDYYGGAIPRDAALAWSGYIGALLEWGLISVHDHQIAAEHLPEIEGENPIIRIFLGYNANV
ncbi:hypothetical protein [Sphaerotilus sp.]|uniref:hypothetical protein n=1 Tax=Sphaerotilus sp. TaxID=2093942 RepID=UPI0034E26F2C